MSSFFPKKKLKNNKKGGSSQRHSSSKEMKGLKLHNLNIEFASMDARKPESPFKQELFQQKKLQRSSSPLIPRSKSSNQIKARLSTRKSEQLLLNRHSQIKGKSISELTLVAQEGEMKKSHTVDKLTSREGPVKLLNLITGLKDKEYQIPVVFRTR